MSTCGYLCPSCEGKGYNEEGECCTWCAEKSVKSITEEEWMATVHEGPCCGDIGQKEVS